jgi:DNA-binding response OmpR family regulator
MDNNKQFPHIWILEDDKGCQFVYEQILKKDFQTTYFDNIKKFKESFDKSVKSSRVEKPTLVIADLMLNDGNFLSYLTNEFHDRLGDEVPFIIVSSDDDIESLRLCFKEGANDYMTKPFKKNELLVKVETILRNKNRFGRAVKPEITIDGQVIDGLTIKQQKLLNLFLGVDSRKIDRDLILTKIWSDTIVHPKTIDVHLYNLRRKLHPYGYMIKSLGNGQWELLSDRL